MKLWAYKDNGTPVTDNGGWTASQLSGNAALQISDTEPSTDYADVSTIENWANYGHLIKDYKYIRSRIAGLVVSIGWSSLSTTEKEIASEYFAVGQTERNEVHTIEEQVTNGTAYHKESVACRQMRLDRAVSEVYNCLTDTDAETVISDVTGGLSEAYVHFGREGTLEGDPEGLFDYIEARSGTSYVLTGLAAKGFTPTQGTLQDLVDDIMAILQNGM